MSLLQHPKLRYSPLGILGIATFAFSIYKLYQQFFKTPDSYHRNQDGESSQTSEESSDTFEHVPYQNLIEDKECDTIHSAHIKRLKYLKDIHYHIILQIMKGNSYEGIVKLSFHLQNLPKNQQNLHLNYQGKGIKYLMVNGKVINSKEVIYNTHLISIPRNLLKERHQNHIEVIFQNAYSFLNEGFSTYFSIDQHNKYSLKQQVIYSINDLFSVQKIMPCINCLNQCTISTEVIHPDHFQVFSNASKSIERFCSSLEYPKHVFLFDQNNGQYKRFLKANSLSESSFSDTLSHASTNFYNRKKANTVFFEKKMSSVHQFFLFSSVMTEVQIKFEPNPILDSMLIRYFCKRSQSQRLKLAINKIHSFILDILKRLGKQIQCLTKLDILIFKDIQSQGAFAPGIILLSQKSLQESTISIKVFYFIVRAIVGMIKLQNTKNNIIQICDILQLNYEIFLRFQEFRNFLYIKNKKYERMCMKLKLNGFSEDFKAKEGHYLRYYCKELKYIITKEMSDKISFQLHHLFGFFSKEKQQDFWQTFIFNYRCFSPLITEPFVKLAIQELGIPESPKLIQQLKQCLKESKYILSFYSNYEISENLSFFLQKESYGLQKRLITLKVKQKYTDYITQRYQKYLPIKSNVADAEIIYKQFKKFNQKKNFHHHEFLMPQINRVSFFVEGSVSEQRLNLQCSVGGWKLLKKLKIYPLSVDWFQLMRELASFMDQ